VPPAESDPVIDSDVDLSDPAQRAEIRPREWDILLATAIGGVLGALARYELGRGLAHTATQIPWSTVVINVSGCLAIGALMSVLLSAATPPRLARPFLGVGVLGGYTTFSSFATDAVGLSVHHRAALAAAYLGATIVACAAAVWIANAVGLALIRRLRGRRSAPDGSP
jgi:fluoride exporter